MTREPRNRGEHEREPDQYEPVSVAVCKGILLKRMGPGKSTEISEITHALQQIEYPF